MLSSCVRLSVRHKSVSTKTAEHRITQARPYVPATIVFRSQRSRRNSNGVTTTEARNISGGIGLGDRDVTDCLVSPVRRCSRRHSDDGRRLCLSRLRRVRQTRTADIAFSLHTLCPCTARNGRYAPQTAAVRTLLTKGRRRLSVDLTKSVSLSHSSASELTSCPSLHEHSTQSDFIVVLTVLRMFYRRHCVQSIAPPLLQHVYTCSGRGERKLKR